MGVGASNAANSYISHLSYALRRQFRAAPITVINAGKGGETAAHMLARFDRDVFRHKPDLVIWQTGVNDAIAGVGLTAFEATLRAGISKLKAAHIDVVLVDQQDYPGAKAVADYLGYLAVMGRVADQMNVALLQRHRIMQHLAGPNGAGIARLVANDKFHMSDVSHDCIGRLLADGLTAMASDRVGDRTAPPLP